MTATVDYLIVDDDEAFSATLARSLQRKGHTTAVANNGGAALEATTITPPERIVLDLKLGSESGLNLIAALKSRAPGAAIVVLTGYSSIPTTVEAIKLGALNYLCKPASVTEIINAFEGGHGNVAIPATPPSVDRLEWEHIQRVLAEHDGNISATARALGMHRRTLQRKLYKRPVRS